MVNPGSGRGFGVIRISACEQHTAVEEFCFGHEMPGIAQLPGCEQKLGIYSPEEFEFQFRQFDQKNLLTPAKP